MCVVCVTYVCFQIFHNIGMAIQPRHTQRRPTFLKRLQEWQIECHLHIYIYIYIHMNTHAYIYNTHTYPYTHACIYSTYTYIYSTQIHIHKQTHTTRYSLTPSHGRSGSPLASTLTHTHTHAHTHTHSLTHTLILKPYLGDRSPLATSHDRQKVYLDGALLNICQREDLD